MEIWLPVAEAAPATPPLVTPDIPEPARRRLTILAVDDDELVLMNTVAMLEEFGHTVVQAAGGGQALEILAGDQTIQLMVTDQAMPGMTGMQLAQRVRETRPDLPIVLATGFAQLPADATPSLPRLSKPFTMSELARVVEQATAG